MTPTSTFASRACAPVQVGPNKWITPLCDEPAPLDVRAYAARPGARPGQRYNLLESGDRPLPAEVDLRRFDGPVRDQGQVGVCWAHALSGVIDSGARSAGFSQVAVSALHAVAKDSWNDIQRDAPSQPLTLEQQWPYEPPKACAFNNAPSEVWCERSYGVRPASWRSNPQLVAELARADGMHAVRFDRVEKLKAKPGDPDQVAAVLAGGRAIWADLAFNREAWQYGQMKRGVFRDYEANRSYGHAVVIVGYRTFEGEQHFLIKNSWGTDWAQGGYAWMPRHLLAKHLRQGFVLRVMPSRGLLPTEGLPQLPVALPLPRIELPTDLSRLPSLGLPLPALPNLPETLSLPAGALPNPCAMMPALPMCAR